MSKKSFLWSLLVPFYVSGAVNTKFIKETKEDIDQALVNFPERVPAGQEVNTKAGPQLSPGDVPKDFARNKEIYNDILDIQNSMLNLMQLILQANNDRKLLPDVEIQMKKVTDLVYKLGIRYDFRQAFDIQRKELNSIMQEIKSVSPTADFMLFKARLEVNLAEIENSLRTKLVE